MSIAIAEKKAAATVEERVDARPSDTALAAALRPTGAACTEDRRITRSKRALRAALFQLMEERGWTDYRLAKEANLSHSTITNLFKRNNAPTLPTLEVICRAFGITLAQFFAEGGEAVEITDEQRELFAKWSILTEKQKALLLEFISTLQ